MENTTIFLFSLIFSVIPANTENLKLHFVCGEKTTCPLAKPNGHVSKMLRLNTKLNQKYYDYLFSIIFSVIPAIAENLKLHFVLVVEFNVPVGKSK